MIINMHSLSSHAASSTMDAGGKVAGVWCLSLIPIQHQGEEWVELQSYSPSVLPAVCYGVTFTFTLSLNMTHKKQSHRIWTGAWGHNLLFIILSPKNVL